MPRLGRLFKTGNNWKDETRNGLATVLRFGLSRFRFRFGFDSLFIRFQFGFHFVRASSRAMDWSPTYSYLPEFQITFPLWFGGRAGTLCGQGGGTAMESFVFEEVSI